MRRLCRSDFADQCFGPRRLLTRQLLYLSGKTLTYAALGAIAGGIGGAIGKLFGGLQDVLSILLGMFLVAIGLGLVGALRRLGAVSGTAAISRAAGRLLTVLRGTLALEAVMRALH